MTQTLDWLKNIEGETRRFLNTMGNEDFSYFKYSFSGDLLNHNNWGLANSVFATKILYITNLLDKVEPQKKENLYNSIIKFSKNNGYIYDPFITEQSLKEIFLGFIKKDENILKTRRAETRQSFAALYLLDKTPKSPFSDIPYTKEGVLNYLENLDWSHPWGAGSHFSHLLFFLRTNAELLNYKREITRELIDVAVRFINDIQSELDGTWYKGNDVDLKERINGAMKVLTGLHAGNIWEFPNPEKLVDTALIGSNDNEACDNFNIAYLLYSAHKLIPEYRKEEVSKFLFDRVEIYKDFYHPETGGFSFYKDKANSVFYGQKITDGKNEADIHGTILFIWGLAIINQVIPLGLDFKIPLN